MKIIVVLSVAFLMDACASTPENDGIALQPQRGNSKETTWSQRTKQDLALFRRALQEQHPAFVVQRELPERHFLSWFETGYQIALSRANSVKDFAGLYFTLRAYSVGFEDEHLLLGLASLDVFKSKLPLKWPGFIVESNGASGFKVKLSKESTDTLPPVGAELESCDGASVQQMLTTNIFPFFGSDKIQKNWKLYGPRLFVDMGNPFIQIPKSCTFIVQHQKKEFPLAWENIAFNSIWNNLTPPPANTKAELKWVNSNSLWITLPTFAPNAEMQADLKKLFSEVALHRNTPRIVIDLRGNTGGSSAWGSEFLRALYSADFTEKMDKQVTSTEIFEYRVSPLTDAYFKNLLGDESKNIKKDHAFFSYVSKELTQALAEGTKSIKVPIARFQKQIPRETSNPVTSKIYVVTDELCFSACLSFMDIIKQARTIIHVGRATSADSVFLQTTNEFTLTDGALTFSIPAVKVHNRKRENNQAYTPRYIFEGDISDTPALQKWVLNL